MKLEGDQHGALVQMYGDQEALYESAERCVSAFEVFEPVVFTKREQISIGNGSRIDSFVKLEGGRGLIIGRNVHVASFAHLNIGGGALTIGDGAAFASGSKVITGGNTPNGKSMSASAPTNEQVLYDKQISIGRNATILTNAVLVSANMGEGAVLAAGAVATKDIPAFEIWAGVPAKRLAVRKGHPSEEPHKYLPSFLGHPLCICGRHQAHEKHR